MGTIAAGTLLSGLIFAILRLVMRLDKGQVELTDWREEEGDTEGSARITIDYRLK